MKALAWRAALNIIQSVTGTADGQTITGLANYGGADNYLFPPTTTTPFSYGGFAFTTSGESFNLFSDLDPGPILGGSHGVDECNSIASPSCTYTSGSVSVA
ncbi:MAG TPA: hypothetical protein VGE92_11305 [Steroidobacteraceae bacterium]|jgi:hypothetical protein